MQEILRERDQFSERNEYGSRMGGGGGGVGGGGGGGGVGGGIEVCVSDPYNLLHFLYLSIACI